jgi:hypothetical protein
MHDHRAGHRGSWSNEQGRKILFDPGERTPVCQNFIPSRHQLGLHAKLE